MAKLISKNMHQTLSELALFCKRYDENIWCYFSIHGSNCCSHAKLEC